MKSVQGMARQELVKYRRCEKMCSIVSCYDVTGALRRLKSVTAVAMLPNQDLRKTKRSGIQPSFLGQHLGRELVPGSSLQSQH